MNEDTKEPCDRFHSPLAGELPREKKYWHNDFRADTMLEFAPEPMHMLEARGKSLKFTVGNAYKVLQKKESFNSMKSSYTFKTTNDEGKEVWVDEKFFIPAERKLIFEKDLGGFDPSPESHEEVCAYMSVPDIRKVAIENNVPPMPDEPLLNEEWIKDDRAHLPFLRVLAGVTKCEYDGNTYQEIKNEPQPSKKIPKIHEDLNYHGTVKDHGNDLINDATRVMAAIDRVFGKSKSVIDTDGLLGAIQEKASGLALAWDNDHLAVSGISTKITFTEVQSAYLGMKKLVSARTAQKIVAKAVALKLKKLF